MYMNSVRSRCFYIEIEIFINDRLIAPNSETTREAVDQDLRRFSQQLFAGSEYSLSYGGEDKRKLFTASVKSAQPFSVADLLDRLS